MRAHRWLGVTLALALGMAAGAFTSCKRAVMSAGAGGRDGGAGTGGSGGAQAATTTGTGGATGDGGPIVCTVAYTNIPKTGPCDLLAQDCPPGSSCKVTSGTTGATTVCAPAGGIKTANEDCYGPDECDAKLTCVGLSKNHPGKCVAFCCPDGRNLPCNGGICNEQVDFGGGSLAFVCAYGKRCQLLTADTCPAGYDCHVEAAAGQGVAVCFEPSPTPVPELGACHYINDCGNMQDCYGAAGNNAGICLYYCALSGPNTGAAPGLGGCPKGETCQTVYQGQTIDTGVDGVGLCIPNGGITMPDAGADGGADAGGDGGADASGDGGADAGDAGPEDAGDGGIADAAEGG
jgi:hypothetical protein